MFLDKSPVSRNFGRMIACVKKRSASIKSLGVGIAASLTVMSCKGVIAVILCLAVSIATLVKDLEEAWLDVDMYAEIVQEVFGDHFSGQVFRDNFPDPDIPLTDIHRVKEIVEQTFEDAMPNIMANGFFAGIDPNELLNYAVPAPGPIQGQIVFLIDRNQPNIIGDLVVDEPRWLLFVQDLEDNNCDPNIIPNVWRIDLFCAVDQGVLPPFDVNELMNVFASGVPPTGADLMGPFNNLINDVKEEVKDRAVKATIKAVVVWAVKVVSCFAKGDPGEAHYDFVAVEIDGEMWPDSVDVLLLMNGNDTVDVVDVDSAMIDAYRANCGLANDRYVTIKRSKDKLMVNEEMGVRSYVSLYGVTANAEMKVTSWLSTTENNYDDIVCEEIYSDKADDRSPFNIGIENVDSVLQGHYTEVDIVNLSNTLPMGGFDFLICYDAGVLALIDAREGNIYPDYAWEYFSYRFGPFGNCDGACPSGKVRLIGMAETNNGPNHPSQFTLAENDIIASLRFYVSNDRTFECQFIPIRFCWLECTDNAISDATGDTLYVAQHVFGPEGSGNAGIDGTRDFVTEPDSGLPSLFGLPDECIPEVTDIGKVPPTRFIQFHNGGIDIICADSIDTRGDINCNGIPNEIADAVMFSNYFIEGLSAFGDHIEASIAASEVNADGIALSVADLVYLIRVLVGDAPPYPKLQINVSNASVSAITNHSAIGVGLESPVDIGGAYFVFNHNNLTIGEPQLLDYASDMTLKYGNSNGVLKVLIYSMEKGIRIASGTENIFAVPISGDGEIELVETQLSDYYGNPIEATYNKGTGIPDKFTLHQNYPNPFNATTTIIYALPSASHVNIEVFNVLGQKIITLLDDNETAGVHSIQWDGSDESGQVVSSGVYLYRITAGNYTSEKKMILMK